MRFAVLLAFLSTVAFGAETKFLGSDHAEYKTTQHFTTYATGLLSAPRPKRLAPFVQAKFYEGELPKAFDWREKGITPIRDQGQCGSCWAFSGTATIADTLALRGIKGYENLSEQFRVAHDHTGGNSGCSGGFMHLTHPQQQGSMLEADCPYTASNRSCAKTTPTAYKLEKWDFVSGEEGVPSTELLKRALYTYGPLSVGVSASGDFMSYDSGVYNAGSGGGINHAVNLVGWNDDGQYWIMRNSWGTSWGENGFMRIRYGAKSIGDGAVWASPDGKDLLPVPPPPPPPPPPPGPVLPDLPWAWIIAAVALLACAGLVVALVLKK